MSFQDYLIDNRKKNMKLPSLVRYYQAQYNPLLDEQVCLAHVINLMVELGMKVTQKEIYYCFKKNYNRDFNGDVQSYVTWLYSLAQPSNKKANSSISGKSKAILTHKLNEVSDCKQIHRHGWSSDNPNGHRCAHCHNSDSRFNMTGYYIINQGTLSEAEE